MAARNQSGNGNGQQVPSLPPKGFRRSGTAAAAGWFLMTEIGNVLSGELTGMFERPDGLRGPGGTSKFFQVKLDQPCKVRADRGEDAKIVDAKPGDFVNVNFGPKTKPWENFIPDINAGAVYRVFGTIVSGKVKLSGGRTMHNFDVFHQMVSPPVETEMVEESFSGSDSAEDSPL
jgi:hypothetical protein